LSGVGETLVMADVCRGDVKERVGGVAGCVGVGEDGLVLLGGATGKGGGESQKAGCERQRTCNKAGSRAKYCAE
jgi:hypothetical protein